MSHDVKVTGVKITDINDLRSALAQLSQRQGAAPLSLTENGTYRAYYASQSRQCPYVIDIEGCKYNIALDKETDENGLDYYVPVIDTWDGIIQKALGTPKGLAPLDPLMQEYTVQAAIRGAQEKGYTVLDRLVDEYGVTQLVIDAETGY
jgi:hypothetical protein